MKAQMITMLLQALLSMLSPEMLRKFADAGLDAIEDAVTASSAKWDDMVVLPLCKTIRDAFGIPDDD